MPAEAWARSALRGWPVTVLVALLVAVGSAGADPGVAAATSQQDTGSAGGAVRVAYPDEPVAWHPALSDLPASVDLAALWGLPLYRIDPAGQLRPVLAAGARVLPGEEGAWAVELLLREGSWSDGRPVVADDVVATVRALLAAVPDQVAPLTGAETVDERRVRLFFEQPQARWPWLLAGGWSVLPAHVLAEGGIERYRDEVPVSGGPFRLESQVPGLRATFVRWDEGPAGAPGVDRIDVYWTPSYETALGLLRDRRIEVAAGYLALNPRGRALRVDGVETAAPVGGATVSLTLEDGALGGSTGARQVVRDAVAPSALVEGLLGEGGDVMTSTVPGQEGPWPAERVGDAGRAGGSLSMLVSGVQEVVSFTSRAVFRDLGNAGVEVGLVRADLDEFPDVDTDATLLVRRDVPFPPLAARVLGEGADEERALRRGEGRRGALGGRAQEIAFEHADERPLYRAPVAHAWRPQLEGVTPSAWPGIVFWDVRAWAWGEGGAPEQAPAIRDG